MHIDADQVEDSVRLLYALAAEERIRNSRVPKFLSELTGGTRRTESVATADALELAASLLLKLGGADARMRELEAEMQSPAPPNHCPACNCVSAYGSPGALQHTCGGHA